MRKDIKYIFNKMKEYSKIPSLTGNERVFLDYLKEDFPAKKHYLCEYEDCLFYEYKNPTKWIVLAHTDRITVDDFEFEIIDGIFIKGQLDNVIAIAIMRLLVEKDIPINILFTTREEVLQSCPQIVNTCFGKDYYILDMDIDVAVDMKEIECGGISIRNGDDSAEFDKELVRNMRIICDKEKINYITKDGDWLVDELGCAIAGVPSIRGMYLGLPILNYHSNQELMNIKCIENVIKLFKHIG